MTMHPTLALLASRIHFAAVLVGVGLTGACGDSPDRAKLGGYCVDNPSRQVCTTYRSDDTTRAFFDAVVGTWPSTCAKTKPVKDIFIKESFTFQKNLKFIRVRNFYADDKCTQALFTFIHEGELRARKTTGAFDFLLDFILLESSLTPDSEVGASSLGQSQACKKSGWEKARSVTLDDCAIIYRQGDLDEQEFKVKNLEHFNGIKLNVAEKTFLLGDEGGELFIPVLEARPSKTRDDLVYTRE